VNPALSISFAKLRPNSYIEIELLDGTLLTVTGNGVQKERPPLSTLYTAVVVAAFFKHKRAEGRKKSTLVSYAPVLNALAEYENTWPLTTETVGDFLDEYRKNGRSATTLNEYWTRLNTFFEWCVTHGYTPSNPIQNVPKMQKNIKSVNAVPQNVIATVFNHIQRVINQAEPGRANLVYERAVRDLAIFRLAYSTGMRRERIATLNLDDLYLEQGEIILRNEADKEGHGGRRFLSHNAQAALKDWLDIRPNIGKKLFVGTVGNGWNKQGILKGAGILRAWKQWQRAAGNTILYSFHALRHSHVSHSLNNGIPVHHVSAQAGHASPDVTLRIYSDPHPIERKRAYEAHNPDDTI